MSKFDFIHLFEKFKDLSKYFALFLKMESKDYTEFNSTQVDGFLFKWNKILNGPSNELVNYKLAIKYLKEKQFNLKKSIKFLHLQIFTKNVVFLIFYSETGSTTVLPFLVRSFKRLPLVGLFSPFTQLQNILKKKERKEKNHFRGLYYTACKIYCKKKQSSLFKKVSFK